MGFKVKNAGQATGYQPTKQRGQVVEANRVAQEQLKAAQVEFDKIKKAQQEQMESMERTQIVPPPAPPEAQSMNVDEQRKKKAGSMRGSLMAGDTGGYNPATGSAGRLGGRSLLG